MSIVLRQYQSDIVGNVRRQLSSGHKSILVRLGCGGGKTVIFSYITHGASRKNKRVLLVAHRRELISQICLSLARFGVSHAVIAPADVVRNIKIAQFKAYGRSYVDHTSGVIVASVQTLVGRLEKIAPVDLLVMDEGHHSIQDTMWGDVIDHFSAAKLLIFTATPCRLDGKGLGRGQGGYADVMVEGPSESWLIQNGYLSPYKLFISEIAPDLSKAKHKRNGEYSSNSLSDIMDKPIIVEGAVKQWLEKADNRLTVAYCVSRVASENLAAEFRAHGVEAAHFDSETDSKERVRIVNDFADGKIRVLCNVGLLTEGFDLASIVQRDVQIDCVLDAAPTESLSLYIQKVMRCMRPRAGKVAVILDAAANCGRMINGQFTLKHGFPDDEREWTLDGVTKRKRSSMNEPDVSYTTCPECQSKHEPAPVCPVCNYVYPDRSRHIEQVAGDLIEVSERQKQEAKLAAEEAKRADAERKKDEQRKAETLEDLIKLGYQRGYKYPEQWARRYFETRKNKRGRYAANY